MSKNSVWKTSPPDAWGFVFSRSCGECIKTDITCSKRVTTHAGHTHPEELMIFITKGSWRMSPEDWCESVSHESEHFATWDIRDTPHYPELHDFTDTGFDCFVYPLIIKTLGRRQPVPQHIYDAIRDVIRNKKKFDEFMEGL